MKTNMDQKKRRNSILKKPPGTDDENTTEITTKLKRRISFSGKKSVKEFLAGEEQATIWGTSYEESAECMQLNAAETGVVGVNDKRIVLRNRRVVVEQKSSNKRRSKKRVCVADNDKENVFTQTAQVENELASDPVPCGTSNKVESPVKSELMLVKSHIQNGRTARDHLDSMNACSTTFDFINYSGAINRTVTIEQSVDVSLDENELQMFKFRVPVSGADVSPNLSVVRDGSSPNIFSSSILMSDDDMKMLKLMKVQMGGSISSGNQSLKMIESAEKNAIDQSKCTDLIQENSESEALSAEQPKQTSIASTMEISIVREKNENEAEDVAGSLEAKNLKRKTIRAETNMDETAVLPDQSVKSHTIIMESEMMDVHSPMRKKPMYKQLDKPMDITAVEEREPPRRQTIHFESATMDESLNDEVILCEESVCVRVTDHPTIHFDQNQIHEDTICEETAGPSPGAKDDHVAMDLSLVDETAMDLPLDTAEGIPKKRQSIHGPVDIQQESPKKRQENKPGPRESIYTPVDIAEDSPKQENSPQSRRQSLHIPTDMVEDSPKSAREREVLKPKSNNRQTTYSADIVREDSVLCLPSASASRSGASSTLRRTIMSAVEMVFDEEKCSRMRQSIYTPTDMIEEDLGVQRKEMANHQKSIYASIDMVEDSPKLTRTKQSCSTPGREQSEVMEETLKFTKASAGREISAVQSVKMVSQERKSIYTPSDMIEDSPKTQKSNESSMSREASMPIRKTIYTTADIVEDSHSNIEEDSTKMQETLKDSRPHGVPGTDAVLPYRKTIYTPTEMIEDSPRMAAKIHRQTVFSSASICADSSLEELMSNDPRECVVNASQKLAKSHMTSYSQETSKPRAATRQTTYAPVDIVEDAPRSGTPDCTQSVTKSSADASRFKEMDCARSPERTNRQTISAPSDILEDSPKPRVRRSICTPVDIMEDSPKALASQPVAAAPKVIVRHMALQTGLMGDNAAMRVLKNKQTKAKIAEPVQLSDSTMDVSVMESASLPTTRPNFCKLNEQLIKGELKALGDERKNKQSLFDRLEMVAADEPTFDSFLKKPSAIGTGFPMQPKKSSFNDYTLELTRNTFDGQRRRGNDYTMEMSTRMHSKVGGVDHDTPDDNMNLSVQMPPVASEAVADDRSKPMIGNSKRQTIHFHNEGEMDVSVSGKLQEPAKSQPNRQTIHFHEHFELDKTSTQTFRNPVAFEKNPRTIHFDDDNNMDESNVVSEQIPLDVSTMDVTKGDQDLEPVKDNQSCQDLTRQSCIMRTSHLDAAPKTTSHSMKTTHAAAAMLEETMDHGKKHDAMDLSTSICPESTRPRTSQGGHAKQHDVMDLSTSICTEPTHLRTSQGGQRRTIHCSDDLELDETVTGECPSLAHVSRMSTLKTRRIDNATEIQLPTHRATAIPTRSAGRKTILLNQDLELDDKTEKLTETLKKPTSRQTIYFQTNDDMEESVMERPVEVKSGNELHCKEDASKALPKPRRMTTFEDVPVDVDESPERTTLRKFSFSRTLNFNEIIKATTKFQSRDSPLVRYNPKLKRCESTTEIDRSLAEYLKAEAAATLYRNSPDHMAMDVAEQSPQSVYYDAEDEQAERKEFLLAEQENHMLEESGMQPLQKTASRRVTQENVSREVAAKQDEPEHDRSDMSFELRTVRANRLNHEFFDKEVSMSPEPEPKAEHAKARRQTILEPEPMMEQSDAESTSPEAPAAPMAQPSRKTIHFTNEDAVDESFFDENLSKPTKMQINRRTVYLNASENSIDDMDATLLAQNIPEAPALSQTFGRSKAAQSMKEILHESNMLFTQSMMKPHLLEKSKATVYFDAKDISLDTVPVPDSPKPEENVDCTPTKANTKSRIPQLIGSAKKLQSMKKSMEFIQQKLPILNCSVRAKVDDDASSRQVEAAPDTPPDETSFSCKPKQLQESFETVEIPRKVLSEPKQLQESFETVEIPRRATTFQRNDTLYLCQNEVDITNISQKSNYRFEDVPITISDVSTYFGQKPPPTAKQPKEETYSPNTTEALCNLDMNKFPDDTQLPKSSDSEDTAYNFDKFKKSYVELTCDSINSTGCNEDIEKTHLSLVNTLDEAESELVRETCAELPLVEVPPAHETTAFSASVCRKCKRHKQTVSQNDTTLSSFVLAPLTEYKMDLAALKELSNKPRVFDVAKIWRQNLRESDSFNFSGGRSAIDLDDDDTVDNFIASLDNDRRMAVQHRQRKEFKQQASFVHTVRKQLQSTKSNWILNDLLLMQNILRFTHTRIRTFAIFISFTQKDPLGVEVEFNEMRIVQNTQHSRLWTAFDYALHYQLLVELPFDLSTLCPKAENLFQLLDHVESVTQDVLKIGKDLLYLVLSSPASLIREPSGGIYIRKYTRTRTAQNEVKRMEFQIEVRNMKRLSYESITQPPLYEFDEKIQLLPTGRDFLRVFLADPLRYMKS